MSKPRLFSWLGKLIIGVFALMSFFLLALFTTFIVLKNNPSHLETVLESVVTRLLGREFQIGELLESELGVESYLLARNVTLANPQWAEDADLVRTGHVLVRVNLPSIWRDGPILIRELELEDLSLNLIAAQENPANWDFWPEKSQQQLSDDKDKELEPHSPIFPLHILSASIVRGDLTLRSTRPDIAVRIDDLALTEPSGGGLLNLDLKGAINNIPLKANGRVGPTAALLIQRDLRMDVAVQLGELFLQSTGSIGNLLTLSAPNLQVDISSPRSQPFLKLLGIEGATDGPLNFKGRLTDAHPGIAVQATGELNGIEVQLSGEVADPVAVSGLQMELELSGPSISEMGAMLGVSGLPETPYDIKGTLESRPQGIELVSFQLLGPSSRLVLDGVVGASPAYLGSHLNLQLSGENQAAFGPWLGLNSLPPTQFQLAGALTRVDSGWQLSDAVFSSDELNLKLEAAVDQLPQPTSLRAQLELNSANIAGLLASYGVEAEGVPALPIAINAVVSGAPKLLKIEHMAAQSGASRLRASGLLGDLSEREEINLAVELKTPNLMEFLPRKSEEGIPALPLNVQGHVGITADGLEVEELNGTIGESILVLQGKLNLVPPLTNSKFSVQFEGPDLGAVLNPWLEREIAAVPFQLAMRADFSSGGVELSQLQATVEDAKLKGQITITDLNNPASARGSFRLEGSNSSKLIGLLGTKAVFSDSSYLLNVGFNSSGDWLRVNPIAMQWGNSDLSGSINYKPGTIATIESDLYSKLVDLPSIIPGMEQLEKAKTEATKGEGETKASTSGVLTKKELADRIIPDEPLDFSLLKHLHGSLKYRADEIYYDNDTLSSTNIDIVLKDGLLLSRKLTWDGTLINGDAALSLRALETGGEIDIRLKATRLPIYSLLGGEAKEDPNAQYQAHLKLNGSSWREMAKNANGALVFRGGGGRLDNKGSGLILGDVFDQVVGRLNPFKETDRYTKVVCHAGAFSIVDGKALLKPGVVVRARKLDFAMGGAIDLHTEELDIVFNSQSRKGIGISASKAITPYFKLGGTLAHPEIVLDPKGVALSGGVAVATAGMSILAESLWDRWIATAKNPCKQLIDQLPEQERKRFRKLLSPVSTGETLSGDDVI